MESHLHEWLHLVLRWIHFIVGVAWIGASFYFNWLENYLDRTIKNNADDDRKHNGGGKIIGELWAVHGGGFYHLTKFNPPATMPKTLHWFKWEAYSTWISGVALLAVVYYFNADLYLRDYLHDAGVSSAAAIGIGMATLVGAWPVYDGLCRLLRQSPLLLAACLFIALTALAWGLCGVLSGRAAYIHVGAAIGTMMVGNVFFVIIPAQKKMVAALQNGAPQNFRDNFRDIGDAKNALLRSRHNNYLTLPVLFMMISAHFPAAHGHAWNWAILAGISAAGVLARHYFNIRPKNNMPNNAPKNATIPACVLAAAFILIVALATISWLTAPDKPRIAHENSVANSVATSTTTSPTIATAEIMPIIAAHCIACHAKTPTQVGFATAAGGLAFESKAAVERLAARIYRATANRTMPLGNASGMTDIEREKIAAWYFGRTP